MNNEMLPPAADADELKKQLDDLELTFANEVFGVGLLKTTNPPQQANFAAVATNIDADQLGRLQVKPIPQAALQDVITYKEFLAPLLENADLLDRSVVLLGTTEVQVVVLRPIPTGQTPSPTGIILRGDGTWPWFASIDGNDIVVLDAKTTAFGGSFDKGDDGKTASGCPTIGNPGLLGCGLPMDGYAKSPIEHAALDGTPIPHMPFGVFAGCGDNPAGAHVMVTDRATGKRITVPAIDLGPAKKTGHALDLTVAAARFFKSNATANNFGMKLDYRILNGAKFVKSSGPAVTGAKAKIVQQALNEWSFWGNSVPGQVGRTEDDPAVLPHLEAFWAEGVHDPHPGDSHTFWSAAFISWCMRTGGAGDAFLYSGRHSVYISRAIQDRQNGNAASSFLGFRLTEYPPQIGDLVCWAREPGISYNNQHLDAHGQGAYEGHCDLVVAVNDGNVEVIGGNVSLSVSRRHLATDRGGHLLPHGNTEYLIAVIQNKLA